MFYISNKVICILCICQFCMPISSSPVSMLSAWCLVAWEKTRLCILSSAPPWCTQRRLSPSKDASLSSTTPTVSTQTFFRFLHLQQINLKSLFCLVLQPLSHLPSQPGSFRLALFILHLFSFSPLHPLSYISRTNTLSCHAPVSLLT